MQARTIFRRMLAWWSVVGDEPEEVAQAVALLETIAICVKQDMLGKRSGAAFDNRTRIGGGGQSKIARCYHGYILTVHDGELPF